MPSLILEGGTFRPIFSAGVMDALLDNNIIFPYCIGVSAGITNGISYISKQKGRNLEVLTKYRNDKRYSGKVLIGVTNAKTGKTEYLDGKDLDDKATFLRATCALPIFFPVIKINNNEYYDGGLCDPIPIKKAIADGNEKHLIVLTQPKGYKKDLSKKNVIVSKLLNRKYPNLKNAFLTRHESYNEIVKFCEELERQGKAIILRPDYKLESFEKDVNKLKSSYDHGYNLATEHLTQIKSLFN